MLDNYASLCEEHRLWETKWLTECITFAMQKKFLSDYVLAETSSLKVDAQLVTDIGYSPSTLKSFIGNSENNLDVSRIARCISFGTVVWPPGLSPIFNSQFYLRISLQPD